VRASLNNSHSFVCSNLARKAFLTEEVTPFERIPFLARLLLKGRDGDYFGASNYTQVVLNEIIRLISSLLLCNNSVTLIDETQLSLYMGYKRNVSYSHYSHIQLYSIFNRINASRFSLRQVLFVRVLMFVQHTPVRSCFSLRV
jgi:hypothetical protein